MRRAIILFLTLCIPPYSWGDDQSPIDDLRATITAAENSTTPEATVSPQLLSLQDEPIVQKKRRTRHAKKVPTINFSYNNEPLVSVINDICSRKNINLYVPQNNILQQTRITVHKEEPVTLDEAWELLHALLQIAGFALIARETFYTITETKLIMKEPLPLFAGVAPEDLPATDERIRYIYSFKNISVNSSSESQKENMQSLIQSMLLIDGEKSGAVLFDATTNSVVLTSSSNSIKAVAQVIAELDQVGYREVIEIISLRHTEGELVAKLLTDIIKETGGSEAIKYPFMPTQKDSAGERKQYFSKTTRVVPLKRNNALIVFGKAQAVERIKNFVNTYIDKPLDTTGKNIVHIRNIKYMDAKKLEQVLNELIKGGGESGGFTQSEGTSEEFGSVIILGETSENIAEDSRAERNINEEDPSFANFEKSFGGDLKQASNDIRAAGGNRLIVVARDKDWIRIERLIESLDQQQPQIALEVLIVDIEADDSRLLGSQIRNWLNECLPGNVQFQAANLQPPWLEFNPSDQVLANPGVASNLLSDQKYSNEFACTAGDTGCPNVETNIAQLSEAGSTVLTIKDLSGNANSGISYVLQVLNKYTNFQIISKPFLVTANNHPAGTKVSQTQIVAGNYAPENGTAIIKTQNLEAAISVNILPRISVGNTINLTVRINVNDFLLQGGLVTQTINKRMLHTNANVLDGDVLSLGGLTRYQEIETQTATPLLDKIPLIGWLFKKRDVRKVKTNLMIFVEPVILTPRIKPDMNDFTATKIHLAKAQTLKASEFTETNRDPIDRAFFTYSAASSTTIDPQTLRGNLIDDFAANNVISEEVYRNQLQEEEFIQKQKAGEIQRRARLMKSPVKAPQS